LRRGDGHEGAAEEGDEEEGRDAAATEDRLWGRRPATAVNRRAPSQEGHRAGDLRALLSQGLVVRSPVKDPPRRWARLRKGLPGYSGDDTGTCLPPVRGTNVTDLQ